MRPLPKPARVSGYYFLSAQWSSFIFCLLTNFLPKLAKNSFMPENAPPLRTNERRPSNARPSKHTSKEGDITLNPIYSNEFNPRSYLWALLTKQIAADAPTSGYSALASSSDAATSAAFSATSAASAACAARFSVIRIREQGLCEQGLCPHDRKLPGGML